MPKELSSRNFCKERPNRTHAPSLAEFFCARNGKSSGSGPLCFSAFPWTLPQWQMEKQEPLQRRDRPGFAPGSFLTGDFSPDPSGYSVVKSIRAAPDQKSRPEHAKGRLFPRAAFTDRNEEKRHSIFRPRRKSSLHAPFCSGILTCAARALTVAGPLRIFTGFPGGRTVIKLTPLFYTKKCRMKTRQAA